MASKSKRTAARQTQLQSRKKRKQGGKRGIPTVLKQISPITDASAVAKSQIESNANAKTELSSNSLATYTKNFSDNGESDEVTVNPSLQVTTKRLKKAVYIAPELHIKGELTRIGAITAIIVSLLVTFSFVI